MLIFKSWSVQDWDIDLELHSIVQMIYDVFILQENTFVQINYYVDCNHRGSCTIMNKEQIVYYMGSLPLHELETN